jgi:hypothetical protein
MADRRGRLLLVTLEAARLRTNAHPLRARRSRLDSWSGIGRVAVNMADQGFDFQLTRYDERGWASYLLHDRDGALAHERDGNGVGENALARDAAGRRGRR